MSAILGFFDATAIFLARFAGLSLLVWLAVTALDKALRATAFWLGYWPIIWPAVFNAVQTEHRRRMAEREAMKASRKPGRFDKLLDYFREMGDGE